MPLPGPNRPPSGKSRTRTNPAQSLTARQLLQELNAAATIPKVIIGREIPRGLSERLRRDAKLLLPEIKMEFDIKEDFAAARPNLNFQVASFGPKPTTTGL